MCTELAVIFIESFRSITQYSNSELLGYMNRTDAWKIFDDEDILCGLMVADIEDVVEIIGMYLTREEQLRIIDAYYARFPFSRR